MRIFQHWNKLLPLASPVVNWELYMEVGKMGKEGPNIWSCLMAQGMSISVSSLGHQSKSRPQAEEGECTQLNVIYHILAPWWPMWKELANPHIALILKSTYIFIPSSHNLGGKKKPTQHSCMVPVGTAVKTCTFSVVHGLKRIVSAVAGSNIPQGGEE